jgi:hypothetical protein
MADEKMRLTAELVDKVSDPIKRMQRGLNDFAKSGKDLQNVFKRYGTDVVTSTGSLQRHSKETGLMRREFVALQDSVKKVLPQFSDLTSKVGEFSLGAGTLVGTVAALGVGLYEAGKGAAEFSEKMKGLRFASRETGLTLTQLKQLELGAKAFGISGDRMTESMYGFADAMTRVHQQDAGFINSIRPAGRYTQELLKLGFEGKSTAEELEALFRAMDKIKKEHPGSTGEQLSRSLASMFGVAPELSRLSTEQFNKLMQDMKTLGVDPFNLKQASEDAVKFNAELMKTEAIISGYKDAIEASLLKPLTSALQLMNDILHPTHAAPITDIPGITMQTTPEPYPTSPSATSKPPSGWSHMPQKKFGGGGIVTSPTNALIGESGPEAVIPLTGGGFDPFVLMQMLIEQLFGPDSTSKGGSAMAMLGGGRSALSSGRMPPDIADILGSKLRGMSSGGALSLGPHSGGSMSGRMPHPLQLQPQQSSSAGKGVSIGNLPAASDAALAKDRAGFAEQLKNNPALAEKIAQISLGENRNPNANQAVIETIFNRARARGQTLEQVTQMYTGKGSPGYYPSSTFSGGAQGMREERLRNMAIENERKALSGGNVSHYATDNASVGLAYTERFGGSSGGYGRPGQPPGKFNFESEFGGRGTGTPGTETFFSPGWGGGRAGYERWRKSLSDLDQQNTKLLSDKQTLNAAAATKVEGTGSLDVTVNGPPGTKVDASGGGIFKQTNVVRNIQMAPAASGPTQSTNAYSAPLGQY